AHVEGHIEVAVAEPGLLVPGLAHVGTALAAAEGVPSLFADDRLGDDATLAVLKAQQARLGVLARRVFELQKGEAILVACLAFDKLGFRELDQQRAYGTRLDGIAAPVGERPSVIGLSQRQRLVALLQLDATDAACLRRHPRD